MALIYRTPGGDLPWYLSRVPEGAGGLGGIQIQRLQGDEQPLLWLDGQWFSEEENEAVRLHLCDTNDEVKIWNDVYGKPVRDRFRRMMRCLAKEIQLQGGDTPAISTVVFNDAFAKVFPDDFTPRALRDWTDQAHQRGYFSKWKGGDDGVALGPKKSIFLFFSSAQKHRFMVASGVWPIIEPDRMKSYMAWPERVPRPPCM